MNFLMRLGLIAFFLVTGNFTFGSTFRSVSVESQLSQADGVFRGTVLKNKSFIKDGLIQTRTVLRVDEVYKGKLPRIIQVVHSGGTVGNVGMLDGFSPRFKIGDQRVLFVTRRGDASLFAMNGDASALSPDDAALQDLRIRHGQTPLAGADLTDQAADAEVGSGESTLNGTAASSSATGLLVDGAGLSARFLACDRGEAIPYLIDTSAMPAGITVAQATNAIYRAMNAWTAVSSVKFQFEGFETFGTNASAISTNDGKIRIQMHDLFNSISGTNTLGVGGSYHNAQVLSDSSWTSGGNVAGNDFHASLCGFVVLKHTLSNLQNTNTLAEVLCHELGHVLSLAHSSTNQTEPNTTLKQAMMYYAAHADGRGATLGTYDPPMLRQVHPTNNLPPFSFPRIIRAVTYWQGTTTDVMNEVELRGYALQGTNFTLQITNATAINGSFSLQLDNKIRYTPSGYYQSPALDPAGLDYYDVAFARFLDGTNASPYLPVRVLNLDADGDFYSDGIPDNWMTTYFGDPDPEVGPNHLASDDFDGDGFTNFQEFLLGSNPTDANSNLHFTSATQSMVQWNARPYDLYEVQSSTNLGTWTRTLNPRQPLTSSTVIFNIVSGSPNQFFRIVKVQ